MAYHPGSRYHPRRTEDKRKKWLPELCQRCGMIWNEATLESRLPGEISAASDMPDTTLKAESKEEPKEPLNEDERGE